MKQRRMLLPGLSRLSRATAAELVQRSGAYESRLMIACGRKLINLKSMLGLLTLKGEGESPLVLMADGPDEEAALAELAELLNRMGEDAAANTE